MDEETTNDEGIDDSSIEEITDDEYKELEEISMFREEHEIGDDENEVEMDYAARNIEPEARTTDTNNQWYRFFEKNSKLKMLTQKRQKQL